MLVMELFIAVLVVHTLEESESLECRAVLKWKYFNRNDKE